MIGRSTVYRFGAFQALSQAAGKGDAAALKQMLGTALSSEEGRRLAQQLRQLMEK